MVDTVDYIIVGAGIAGCVLANRLSADPKNRVVVLEAGPMDRDPLIHIPIGIGKMHPERRHDWGYDSEPEPFTDDRVIEAMRGKVVGGSSSINVMAYVRGHREDFNRWAQKGATGWGYDDVLPYFRRNESWEGDADPEYRGSSGDLTVVQSPDRDPLLDAWIESAKVAGYGYTPDYNAAEQEGFTRTQFTIRNGKRCSAAVAFLKPVLSRPNLELKTEALAGRILFEGKKAVGIEYSQGGVTRTLNASREVILSGGVFNSPHLLMLSGIGPAGHLQEHGIDVLLDSPGVGENLQDHLAVMVSYDRKIPGTFTYHAVRPPRSRDAASAFLWHGAGDDRAGTSVRASEVTPGTLCARYPIHHSQRAGRRPPLVPGLQACVPRRVRHPPHPLAPRKPGPSTPSLRRSARHDESVPELLLRRQRYGDPTGRRPHGPTGDRANTT